MMESTTNLNIPAGDAPQVGLDLEKLDRDLGYILRCLASDYKGAAGATVNDIRARVASIRRAMQPGSNVEPVARLHIRLEDDGLAADVEVLDGTNLQVEHSPVDVYLAPPASKQDMAGKVCTTEEREQELLNTLTELMTWQGPQGTVVRLLDVKCRLIDYARRQTIGLQTP